MSDANEALRRRQDTESDRELSLRDRRGLFRELVEHIREVFWITTPDKETMLYISPGYEEIWRRTRRQLYREPKSWLDAIHPEDRDRVRAALPRQARGEYDIEYRIVRPDGEVRCIRDRAFPIRDEQGKVQRIAGIAEDITDRWRAEESTRELLREQTARAAAETSAQRARLLAEASTVLSSSLDYSETLQSVARLAVRRVADICVVDLAAEQGEAMARVAAAHRDPAEQNRVQQARRSPPGPGSPTFEVFESGKALLIPELDESWRDRIARSPEHRALMEALGPRSLIVVPLVARARVLGTITLASTARRFDEDDFGLAEELAGRAALAVDNARLYNEALAANQAKSDFFAVMSHELRTPLNAIIGYIDLLEAEIAGPLEKKQDKQIRGIERNARHLLELIEEILTFSRMGAGSEALNVERVDLGTLLSEAADELRPRAAEAGLGFEVQVPETGVEVEVDPIKVKRILRNLLSNAIKFTPEGRIEVCAALRQEQIRFEVTDTGIGIEAEHQDRIFEPFWQIEEATIREKGGTGLGLSVARYLARLMGGDVFVESAPGRGSTFVLQLPARPGPGHTPE